MEAPPNVPDLADIIITYLKESWPNADYVKMLLPEYGPGIAALEVNNNYFGIVSGNSFATWNIVDHKSVIVPCTDPKFFEVVRHWAALKGGLTIPT